LQVGTVVVVVVVEVRVVVVIVVVVVVKVVTVVVVVVAVVVVVVVLVVVVVVVVVVVAVVVVVVVVVGTQRRHIVWQLCCTASSVHSSWSYTDPQLVSSGTPLQCPGTYGVVVVVVVAVVVVTVLVDVRESRICAPYAVIFCSRHSKSLSRLASCVARNKTVAFLRPTRPHSHAVLAGGPVAASAPVALSPPASAATM